MLFLQIRPPLSSYRANTLFPCTCRFLSIGTIRDRAAALIVPRDAGGKGRRGGDLCPIADQHAHARSAGLPLDREPVSAHRRAAELEVDPVKIDRSGARHRLAAVGPPQRPLAGCPVIA